MNRWCTWTSALHKSNFGHQNCYTGLHCKYRVPQSKL